MHSHASGEAHRAGPALANRWSGSRTRNRPDFGSRVGLTERPRAAALGAYGGPFKRVCPTTPASVLLATESFPFVGVRPRGGQFQIAILIGGP